MAASNLNLGKASGGVLNVQPADGTTTTSLVLPAINGTVVAADSNGNVGIGVTPSAWNTNVSTKSIQLGYSTSVAALYAGTFYNNAFLGLTANSYVDISGVSRYVANSYATQYTQSAGSHYWQVAPSGTAGNAITWTNAMTLDANNNLSLGFGNLLINNLSTSSGNTVVMYGANKTNYIQLMGRDTINTDGVLLSYMGNVLKSAILANGNFQSATNSYGSTSDAKLKENVQDASPKLDKLMQVQVRTFNYIGQEDKQIGVVAQEIEKIFPSIVYETKDTKQVEVEKEREITLEDGTVDIEKYTETETVETGEVTKNVKYSVIYMMMLKGLQEMNAIITEQNARIASLEKKLQGITNV